MKIQSGTVFRSAVTGLGFWLVTLFILVPFPALAKEKLDDTLSLELAKQRFETYASADDNDKKSKALADVYARVVTNLERAAENKAEQERLEKQAASAKTDVEQFNAELQQLQRNTISITDFPQHLPTSRLQAELNKAHKSVDQLRVKEASLEESLLQLRGRVDGVRLELHEMDSESEDTSGQNQSGTATYLGQAKSDEQLSAIQLRNARRARLEVESRTAPDRELAIQAELLLVTAKRKDADKLLAHFIGLDRLKEATEAQQLKDEVLSIVDEIQSTHPEIIVLKKQLLVLADEQVEIVAPLTKLDDELKYTNQINADLELSFGVVREQLNIGSFKASLGQALTEQYQKLDYYEKPRFQKKVAEAEARVRLREFQVRQMKLSEASYQANFYQAIEDTAAKAGAEFRPEDHALTLREGDKLLSLYSRLLDVLNRHYISGVHKVIELNQGYKEQKKLVEGFRKLLEQNLVWQPSRPPINLQEVLNWPNSVQLTLKLYNWQELARQISTTAWLNLPLVVLMLTGFVAVLRYRKVLVGRLLKGGMSTVNWQRYSFKFPLEALLIHLVLALPVPLLLVTLGWLGGSVNESKLSEAWSFACYKTAVTGYVYLLITEMLKLHGYARQHLRWKNARVQNLAQWFGIALWFFLPFYFFNTLLHGLQTPDIEPTSRISGILLIIGFFLFSLMLVKGSRGMFNSAFFSRHHPVVDRLGRVLVWAILICMPISILLELFGYHFTFLILNDAVMQSIALLIAVKVLIDTSVLGVAIASRRNQAVQNSDDSQATDADLSSEEKKDTDVFDITDWDQLSESAESLLYVIAVGVSALILASIWSHFLIALEIFDGVNLWSYKEEVDGVTTLVNISLFDLGLAMLTLLLTFVLSRGAPSLIRVIFDSYVTKKGVLFAIQKIFGYLIATIGVVVVLNQLGFGWSKIQWMAAGVSVGIGFALQEIFSNFFAGLMMLFERPIRIGDVVTVGEDSGTVQHISMRATTILDFDNREVIIPNKMFVAERLTNWTLNSAITRSRFVVGISYDADPRDARDSLLKILQEHELIVSEPAPAVVFYEFGASSLNLRCMYCVADFNDRLSVQNDLHMRITEVFRDKGIEIAYPQMDLHLRSVDEDAGNKLS